MLTEEAAIDGISSQWFGLGATLPHIPVVLGTGATDYIAMLVGKWSFPATGPQLDRYQFDPTTGNYQPLETDVTYQSAPAQGLTITSPGWFELGDHAVVAYNGQIWDPSYGTGPFPSISAWANQSIAGYAVEIVPKNLPADYTVYKPQGAPCPGSGGPPCIWKFIQGPGNVFSGAQIP
jgi:hypothetical protein